MTEQHPERDGSHVSRRGLLQAVGAIGGASVLGSVGGHVMSAQNVAETPATEKRVIHKRRIHQSLMGWCFNPMPTIELAKHAADLGFEAIEGIDSKFYPDVQKLGLQISLVSSHGFQQGTLGSCKP
jgi:hydroxypyruvate isomerase